MKTAPTKVNVVFAVFRNGATAAEEVTRGFDLIPSQVSMTAKEVAFAEFLAPRAGYSGGFAFALSDRACRHHRSASKNCGAKRLELGAMYLVCAGIGDDKGEEEAVLAKIIHARPTNILILRKISLFYPPPVAYTTAAGAAIAAFFILATALSVSWRSGSPPYLLWYEFNERESVNLD